MEIEEAIELLCAYGIPQDENRFQEALNIAIESLQEKLCGNFDKWIPVTEKKPDYTQWIICTDGYYISVERFKTDALDHFYPEGRYFTWEKVTAWMPLPQPHKAESEEQGT